MIEIVLNHIQQQNRELTFTQIPQPIQSSSEMKAIFDWDETSIQSLPASPRNTQNAHSDLGKSIYRSNTIVIVREKRILLATERPSK
jgi:hypothetical protein